MKLAQISMTQLIILICSVVINSDENTRAAEARPMN